MTNKITLSIEKPLMAKMRNKIKTDIKYKTVTDFVRQKFIQYLNTEFRQENKEVFNLPDWTIDPDVVRAIVISEFKQYLNSGEWLIEVRKSLKRK